MSTTTAESEPVEVANIEGRPGVALRRNALGLPALFFCIATAAAPMTALLFNVPVIVSGSGWAAPAAFLVATVMLAVFSVGYIEMSRRVTSAGGFYSFVSHGFGQAAGLGTAAVVTISYAILTAAIIGVFGYFAQTTIQDWLGLNIPVAVFLFGVLIVNVVFLIFDVHITARVLGVFFIAEVAGALILALAITFQGGKHGLSLKPLNPVDLFNNPSAIAVFGAAAPGIALFGAFWSWVGFEMAPNYGEETKASHRVFGKATFGTLFVLGVVYVFVTWAFVNGYGLNGVAQGVKAQFDGTVVSAFYPLTTEYVGAALTDAFKVLIITSAFACQLAFFNTAARYLFALGRERILPSALGRTHSRHQTPLIAGLVLTAGLALYILGFVIDDPGTTAALTKLATWSPLVGVLGILGVQALVSFAIVRYFRVVAPEHGHVWKTFIAPLLGGGLMLFSAYLLLSNRETLAGAKGVPFVTAVPWIVGAIFLLGVLAAVVFRQRDPARYAAVGRFVHQEA